MAQPGQWKKNPLWKVKESFVAILLALWWWKRMTEIRLGNFALSRPSVASFLVVSYCVRIMFVSCKFIVQGDLCSVSLCKLGNAKLKLLWPSLTKWPKKRGRKEAEDVAGDEMSRWELYACVLPFSCLCVWLIPLQFNILGILIIFLISS